MSKVRIEVKKCNAGRALQRRWFRRGDPRMPNTLSKAIGDPCPKKCGAVLIRRTAALKFRGHVADAAYCPHCRAAWEIAGEEIVNTPGAPTR